jgi:hypothetical protein
MPLPKSLGKKLNPTMLKDPIHFTLISSLRHLFDASNFDDLTTTQAYTIIENLSQQSRYEYKSDIFLHPNCRDSSKSNKLDILKEYYDFCKPKILQIINNYESSFYCKVCYSKSEEDSGLFEAISNREYDYKDGQHTCANFDSILNVDSPLKIVCKNFKNEEFSFELYPDSEKFILYFTNGFNKHVFTQKLPPIKADTTLHTYSCDISNIGKPMEQRIEKINTFYVLSKLKCDGDEIERVLSTLTKKALKKFSTIVGQERKIYNWIKSKGFDMPAHEFINQYYPDNDPADLLEMALKEEKYQEAFERVQKDAEIGSCDLSSL